ncbi:hypothetical protein [Mucilaginibacter sp.]|uniref:hypothetical protein n=1 Tax=Mucilaginibacter sp. TaxID=1882438 RepID=UPI0025DEC758|nr:hypothetical protein [Mucilaginibacter sp.]
MYCGVYAPWDHYPKFLRQSEVRNPFIPLKGFFDANDVEGHFEKLKRWRHYVVNFEHYNDERFGPGNLLYDYELNIRMLECLYILFLDYQDHQYVLTKIEEEQLMTEKDGWIWYPSHLTKAELLNPYLIIKAAFDEIQPEQFRDHLWEWINAALSSNAIDETTTPGEIITVYEHIKKMYSAAWLIFQRETNKPSLPNNTGIDAATLSKSGAENPFEPEVGIIDQMVPQSPATKPLKTFAKAIIGAAPMVKAIMLIGTIKDPFGHILYILIDDAHYELSYLINQVIEHAVRPLINISTVVDSVKLVTESNPTDRRFLNWSLMNGLVIYEAEELRLDALRKDIVKIDLITAPRKKWLTLATLHYKEINYYIRRKDLHDALHAIHQSMEAVISEFMDVKVGFETTIPNLTRLITLTLIVDSKISDWFTKRKDKHPEIYNLIENVYPESVRETLIISEEQIMELMQETGNLLMLISDLLNE